MTQPQIMIAGHSHTTCLGLPLASEDGSPKVADLVNGERRFQGLVGAWPRDQAYWDFLTHAGAGRKVALFWAGNAHNCSHLFAFPPPFDFFLYNRPDLPVEAGVHVVPETAIRATFASTFEQLHRVIVCLQTAKPDCQPIICGTPPPKGNNVRLRDLLPKDCLSLWFAEEFKVDLKDLELSPPRLRFKLWMVLQKMMEDIAHAHAVPFVAVPASVQTEDGLLTEAYWGEDTTHANEAYGRVMLDHLAAELDLLPNPH
jgi:hypothetical protein